jgi:large-conductance mechanosensitive channel
MLKEFREFLLRGNVIDLAVAVVIGAAVSFVVVKPVNALQARRKAGLEPEPEAVPEDVVLLGEIRDLLRANRA